MMASRAPWVRRKRLDKLLESRGEKVDTVIRLVVDEQALLARVTKRFEEQGP